MIANQAAFNGVNSLGARLNGYRPIEHPVRQPMQPAQALNMPSRFSQPVFGQNPVMQQFGYRPPQAPVNPYPMSPIVAPYMGFGNSMPIPQQGGPVMPMQNPDQPPQQLNAPLPVRDPMQRPVVGQNSLAML